MAKKNPIGTSDKRQTPLNGANQAQFLNYTLTVDEASRFKKWRDEQTIETFNEAIEGLLDKRYSFSVKWDTFNECYSAFITAPKGDDNPVSIILSGRGRSAVSAALGALFRHYHIFEGVWPVETVVKRGTDDD